MTIFSLRTLGTAMGAVLLFAGHAAADVPVAVPEPATLSLLAAGAGMYLLNRRRRK